MLHTYVFMWCAAYAPASSFHLHTRPWQRSSRCMHLIQDGVHAWCLQDKIKAEHREILRLAASIYPPAKVMLFVRVSPARSFEGRGRRRRLLLTAFMAPMCCLHAPSTMHALVLRQQGRNMALAPQVEAGHLAAPACYLIHVPLVPRHMQDGLESKNAKTRVVCCDEVAAIIIRSGPAVYK